MHVNGAIRIAGLFCRALLTGIFHRIICAYFQIWLQNLWYSRSRRYAPTQPQRYSCAYPEKQWENFKVITRSDLERRSALRQGWTHWPDGIRIRKI